ncbi:MAG: hypothetical protein Q8934_19620 [Bacillota bacterium]|nr:hypothetical protein [Bacillota bacterium]
MTGLPICKKAYLPKHFPPFLLLF